MPVLDAKALKTDPKGLEFLRDVLRPGPDTGSDKNAATQRASTRRRKLPESIAEATLSR